MPKQSEAASSPVRRILLIDDNRNGLAARKSVLEAEGYAVTACSSPKDALELFSQGEYHLVITDYRMPVMNGTEVIQALRKQRPDIRVVLVSGMVEVLGLNELNTGADAVVAKNSTEVPNMVRTVSRLLRSSRKPTASAKPGAAAARRKAG
jgi:two-component system response regulator (stage 0 sporulation protein F)